MQVFFIPEFYKTTTAQFEYSCNTVVLNAEFKFITLH